MTAKKKRSPKASPPAKKSPAGQAPVTPPAPVARSGRAKATSPRGASKEKKYSALNAAAQVLQETGKAMTCPELIAQMAARGYWSSPKGKTPWSTLYAALAREIKLKGAAARFQKTGRGTFAYRVTRGPRS
jgi:HB1, ASXL, restriction endonuclease HTH domain